VNGTKLEKYSIGIIESKDKKESKINFIWFKEAIIVSNSDYEIFDPLKTGDLYLKKVCNVCHRLLDYIKDKIIREEIRKLPKKEQENILEKQEYSNISYEKSQHIAKRFIYDIYSFFHYVLIRVTSVYVGEHSLEPLFKSMECNMNSLNDKLLFLAVFLEYKNSIPEQTEQKIRDIEKERNNNSIAFNTLRRLVFNFMYINDVPSKQRQSLCSLLKISSENEQKIVKI